MKLNKKDTLEKLRQTIAQNPPRGNVNGTNVNMQRQRQVVQDSNGFYGSNVQPRQQQVRQQPVRQQVSQQRNIVNQNNNMVNNFNTYQQNPIYSQRQRENIYQDNLNNSYDGSQNNNYSGNQSNEYQQDISDYNLADNYDYQNTDLNFDYSNIEPSGNLPYTEPTIETEIYPDSVVDNSVITAKTVRQRIIENNIEEDSVEEYILALVPKNAVSFLQNIKTIEQEDTLSFNGGHYALVKLDK